MGKMVLTLVLLSMALALGNCSKCDFPTGQSFNACRGDAPVRS